MCFFLWVTQDIPKRLRNDSRMPNVFVAPTTTSIRRPAKSYPAIESFWAEAGWSFQNYPKLKSVGQEKLFHWGWSSVPWRNGLVTGHQTSPRTGYITSIRRWARVSDGWVSSGWEWLVNEHSEHKYYNIAGTYCKCFKILLACWMQAGKEGSG